MDDDPWKLATAIGTLIVVAILTLGAIASGFLLHLLLRWITS